MSDKIQAAIFAALGCTTIDYKKPTSLDVAATQIADFVKAAIDETHPYARLQKVEEYVRASLALFKNDPPDTDSQHGFLDALMAIASEGLGIDLNEAPPRKPGRPNLRLVISEPTP